MRHIVASLEAKLERTDSLKDIVLVSQIVVRMVVTAVEIVVYRRKGNLIMGYCSIADCLYPEVLADKSIAKAGSGS